MKFENMRKLARDQKGLSTVEYTVLLVLIVACSVGLWQSLGEDLVEKLGASNVEFGKVKVVPSP